jgi:hypothetical protein
VSCPIGFPDPLVLALWPRSSFSLGLHSQATVSGIQPCQTASRAQVKNIILQLLKIIYFSAALMLRTVYKRGLKHRTQWDLIWKNASVAEWNIIELYGKNVDKVILHEFLTSVGNGNDTLQDAELEKL